MIRDQRFWIGVAVGVAGVYVYHRYAMGKGKAAKAA